MFGHEETRVGRRTPIYFEVSQQFVCRPFKAEKSSVLLLLHSVIPLFLLVAMRLGILFILRTHGKTSWRNKKPVVTTNTRGVLYVASVGAKGIAFWGRTPHLVLSGLSTLKFVFQMLDNIVHSDFDLFGFLIESTYCQEELLSI